jgi:hypothetical protein
VSFDELFIKRQSEEEDPVGQGSGHLINWLLAAEGRKKRIHWSFAL